MEGVDDLNKSNRLKNSKLAQNERKQKEAEEIAAERELEYEKSKDELDSIMQRIDKYWYDGKNN